MHPSINSGYRLGFGFSEALGSVLLLHNETLSIWTHLTAIPFFLWWSYSVYEREMASASTFDQVCFIVYVFAAIQCFSISVMYHLFRCVSDKLNNILLRLDICGILALISCAYFPTLAYIFTCEHDFIYFVTYTSLVLFFAFVGALILIRREALDSDLILVIPPFLLSAVSVVPIFHFHYVNYSDPVVLDFYFALFSSLIFYGIGLLCFVFYFPENYLRPGAVDSWFHSHVLWHLFVVVGAIQHFQILRVLFAWKSNRVCFT